MSWELLEMSSPGHQSTRLLSSKVIVVGNTIKLPLDTIFITKSRVKCYLNSLENIAGHNADTHACAVVAS